MAERAAKPNEKWSIGALAACACLMEATAPKPGNVHRGADFPDLGFFDFARSALAVQPAFDAAPLHGRVGKAVREAVAATQETVGTNTNLGIALLFAPLACVPEAAIQGTLEERTAALRRGVEGVLAGLSAADAAEVYEAIRLAAPGGMGKVDVNDVAEPPPPDLTLLAAMRQAAGRDLVAAEYASGFAAVFDDLLPTMLAAVQNGATLEDAVIYAHVGSLARRGDSLILRKAGEAAAQQAKKYAAETLAASAPFTEEYHEALADLDFWLRSDGNRRNPGATADLVAAALFAGLRIGALQPGQAWSSPDCDRRRKSIQ